MASSGQFQLLNTFNYTPTCWFEPFPHREKDIVRVNSRASASPVGVQSSARVTSSRLRRQVAPRSGIVDMCFEKLSCKEDKDVSQFGKDFPELNLTLICVALCALWSGIPVPSSISSILRLLPLANRWVVDIRGRKSYPCQHAATRQ